MKNTKLMRVGDDFFKLRDHIKKNSVNLSDKQLTNIVGNFIISEKLDTILIRQIKRNKRRGFI